MDKKNPVRGTGFLIISEWIPELFLHSLFEHLIDLGFVIVATCLCGIGSRLGIPRRFQRAVGSLQGVVGA
jgi:hypothetical protein